ncbi:MAG: hypothetical protein JWO67_960 [Streptosporangiaceae bacterium]|jgi:hypothetical protein|nr:hypothetical protein [Streptosporangiaceae bacterium]
MRIIIEIDGSAVSTSVEQPSDTAHEDPAASGSPAGAIDAGRAPAGGDLPQQPPPFSGPPPNGTSAPTAGTGTDVPAGAAPEA